MNEYVEPPTYEDVKRPVNGRWPCAVWNCSRPVSAPGVPCGECRLVFGRMIGTKP